MDREKVIKGLEMCTADIPIEMHRDDMCQKCPYHNEKYAYCFEKNKLMQDALALLKEQEPVEPIRQIEQTEWAIRDHCLCGHCRKHLIFKWMFCPYCGRAVKWDAN
jgi:hypothetical protein